MGRYAELLAALPRTGETWLVTGAAGFIGSHLVEVLLSSGQRVRGLDDFSAGKRANLEEVRVKVGDAAWSRFALIEGDLRDPRVCGDACTGAAIVLHQAALGSVPRSIADPRAFLAVNVSGFAELLLAARDQGVRRVVYASSSSVYGDAGALAGREGEEGRPLSPYAASKSMDEELASAFAASYGQELCGLRYFNVFGPRQDPDGPYAAVIPRWIRDLVRGERPTIHGDGLTSRDFCPVACAVQANLLAARAPREALNAAYNIALGRRTNLNELFLLLRSGLAARGLCDPEIDCVHGPSRPGDVRHSQAAIALAEARLGYVPQSSFEQGLELTLDWYARGIREASAPSQPHEHGAGRA
jgi:UDP-N-acetylglucosamine 4-epimerase